MNGGRVDNATMTLASPDGHPVPAQTGIGGNNSPTLQFDWPVSLPYNGIYTVRVDGTGTETPVDFNGPEADSRTNTFKVEAPPATPSGVKATVDQAKRTITISWAANPEPDVLGYGVYRKDGSQALYAGAGTSYTDTLGSLPAGTYQYRVYAVRPNADGTAAIVSVAPATDMGKVNSQPPPPPTSSTTPSGTSGGSGTKTGGTTNATSGAGSSTKTPTVATHGKVDLSGFTALLPNGKLPTARQTPAPDSGFGETLPFDSSGGAAPLDGGEGRLGGCPRGSAAGVVEGRGAAQFAPVPHGRPARDRPADARPLASR